MIDWHSHILPQMDDGSKSVQESLDMLSLLKKQNISKVAATPHFHISRDSTDSFFERREHSWNVLKQSIPDGLIDVMLGAEVSYYSGISKLDCLESFVIFSTDILLLEMPISSWSPYVVDEVLYLSRSCNFRIALAHIERYLPFGNDNHLRKLREYDILMQSNSSLFNGFRNKRIAMKLLKSNMIDLIGSDTHNMASRPPNMNFAMEFFNTHPKFSPRFLN